MQILQKLFCGKRKGYKIKNALELESFDEKEIRTFIGTNSTYYINKWVDRPSPIFKGWNWMALFFPFEWMMYRKMYAEAIILILVAMLALTGFFMLSLGIDIDPSPKLLRDIFATVIAVFGNALYYKKTKRALNKTTNMNKQERIAFLSHKGDVSIIALIVCIVIEIVIAFL